MLGDAIIDVQHPVLVTGAAGFIGTSVVRTLLEYRLQRYSLSDKARPKFR